MSAKITKKSTIVKKIIKRGREQGFVTQDDILEFFPQVEDKLEELDELYATLLNEGIDIYEIAQNILKITLVPA